MKGWVFRVPFILLLLLAAPNISKAEGIGTTVNGTLQGVTGNLTQETNELLDVTVKETSATVGSLLQESVHLEKVVKEVVPIEKAAVNTGKVDEAVKSNVTETKETGKQTSNAVQKTVESTQPVTKPIVKTARETLKTSVSTTTKDTSSVAESAEKTARTLEQATDHAVEKLPAMPVVKPVIEAVHKENKKVAGSIERKVPGTVDRTVQKPVVDRIEQTTRQTVEPKLEQPAEPAETVLEPRSDTPGSATVEPGAQDGIEQSSVPEHEAVMEEELASNGTVEQGEGPAMVSAVQMKKMQALAEREPADNLFEVTTKANTDASLAKQSVQRDTKPISGQNEKSKVLLTKPLAMTLAPPVAKGPVHTSSSIGGVHDVALGVLILLEDQSLTTGNEWIKGNQFALKQWIYDPLGQPPKSSPFFN